ncbi:UDP-N-acetylmuramoyl-L-alanyl-D-glutamate--2,6-diaminopimelate ligase MurE homolog, chloroplastic-like [Typha latifolia]|uniref:UDP-N-acetylmuramoyl-L-alanyl-D-glutamate--2, 6-diaminopimelate ligase MurE homolog, chloroplastic-like n=1 Tax=Typha latifolia TaxID=4733 RepID=UPI003C2B47F8
MAFPLLSSLLPLYQPPSPHLFTRQAASPPSIACSCNNELFVGSSNPQVASFLELHEDSTAVLERPRSQILDTNSNPTLGSSSGTKINHSLVSRGRIVEPEFQMTLAELLHESGVCPVSMYGDLGVSITGVQNDSRKVCPGDLFICCIGRETDGHLYIMDAIEKGTVAVISCNEIHLDEIPSCAAVVVVENTNSLLPVLAAAFYKNPSKRMGVVGITGTNGKTTTAHLVRAIHEAMGLRTGMLGTVGYYIHGNTQLEAPNTTPDAAMVQKLMAKMVQNGIEAVVMEVSSHGLALGRCEEVDFNVAVFMNLTRDHYDFHRTEEEYRNSKLKLFSKMVDPKQNRKIVNIDDPHAPYFIAQGSRDVPVVTFALENKDADVYPLKIALSLMKTKILIYTPKGILQISSGLIGRHNAYNILAGVSVGMAVGASLEEIARGIEGVSGVSGRCEPIDEGQPFGVIVDFAHSPDALSRLLDSVRELGARRIITVFGCAGESDKGKRSIMTKLAVDKSEVVILTSDNPKTENPLDILDDMLAGVGWTMHDYVQYCKNNRYPSLANAHRLFVHDNRRVAIRAAVAMAKEGDVVVVAGRGHENYQLQGHKKVHLDDREECREALNYVDKLHRAGLGKRIPIVVIREPLLSFPREIEDWCTPERKESFYASPVH